MSVLANRVQRIKPSPTLAIAARATQMQKEGHDIINLSVGEPDFDTPEHIKDAAIKALRDGFTKYTPVPGIPSLKQAIIDKLAKDNQLNYQANQIVVSCGVKQGLYNLMQAVINRGDEVIIPAPYWVSYPDMVLLADGTPVFISTGFDQHFKITPEQLAATITPKTKLIILNSPSNPSGMGYTKAELAALGKVLLKHPQVFIASDDMYEAILWGTEPFANIVNACPELYDRTVVFNGVSKSYAMTGWRIGYAAGPVAIISAMTNIQSQSTSNPNSIAQVAAQAALEGDQGCIPAMVNVYKRRHDLLYKGLNAIPGIQCHPADGTFYCFARVSELIKSLPDINNDLELADLLLSKAGIAIVPGSAFGDPDCIRFSYATSDTLLQTALERLAALVSSYQLTHSV